MPNKEHATITLDLGLSERLRDKGIKVSKVCNIALNNALMDKEVLPLETREEIDKLKADYETTKSGIADINSDYDILDTTTKQQIQQLKDALSQKDNELKQKDYTIDAHRQTIDRHDKRVKELTAQLQGLNESADRTDKEHASTEQCLNQEILNLKDANTSQEKAYTKQITEKDATITRQNAEIYTLKQELYTQNAENRDLKDTRKTDRHDYGELKDRYNLLQKKQNLFGYNYLFLPILTLFAILLILYVVRTPIISGFSYVYHAIINLFGWIYTQITNIKV